MDIRSLAECWTINARSGIGAWRTMDVKQQNANVDRTPRQFSELPRILVNGRCRVLVRDDYRYISGVGFRERVVGQIVQTSQFGRPR
jgi:hypothetical protein